MLCFELSKMRVVDVATEMMSSSSQMSCQILVLFEWFALGSGYV